MAPYANLSVINSNLGGVETKYIVPICVVWSLVTNLAENTTLLPKPIENHALKNGKNNTLSAIPLRFSFRGAEQSVKESLTFCFRLVRL